MHLRELLPWRDFVVDTSWPPGVAHTEIAKEVATPRWMGVAGEGASGTGDALFVGRAEGPGRFRFTRRIGYRNSFRPVIQVVVEASHHGGSRLRVRMRLHPFVMVFVGLWLTLATLIGLPVGVLGLAQGQIAALVGLVMPLFGVGITCIPFAVEARIAERALRDLFAAAPALPEQPATGGPFR